MLFSLFATCLVLATKYYEEVAFVNQSGYGFFKDAHFEVVTSIPKNVLAAFQLHVLETIDFELFVSEYDYTAYSQAFMDIAQIHALNAASVHSPLQQRQP